MGYSFRGACYSDSAAVLAAFKASFPVNDGVGFSTLSSASVSGIPVPGAISYTVNTLVYSSGSTLSRSSSFVPSSCTTEGLAQYPLPDVAFILAIVLLWAIGFRTGQS